MKSTNSLRRTPDRPLATAAPYFSEPTKRVENEVELIVASPTEPRELDFGKHGLFPVKNGQVLCKRYELQKMLGHGSYGTVHLAKDKETDSSVAMKITRSGDFFNKLSDTEIGFMIAAKEASKHSSDSFGFSVSPMGSGNIVSLIDSFRLRGSHGDHVVMVMELLGPSLFSILRTSNQKVLLLHRIKSFSKNILEGLRFLHLKCKTMHLDIKSENLFVTTDPHNMNLSFPNCSARLKIGDFGISANTGDILTRTVQTCNYRAPESFLKSKITPVADIWSVGCTVYEMVTRMLLFPGDEKEQRDAKWFLCRISKLLGPVKMEYFERNETNEEIFQKVFGNQESSLEMPLQDHRISPEQLMREHPMRQSEAEELNGFLKALLEINPKKRLTAIGALKHPFITNPPEKETEEDLKALIDMQIEEHLKNHAHCYINHYPWASSSSQQSSSSSHQTLSKNAPELAKKTGGFSSNRVLAPTNKIGGSTFHSASQSMNKNKEASSNNAAHWSYNRASPPMKKNKEGAPTNRKRE